MRMLRVVPEAVWHGPLMLVNARHPMRESAVEKMVALEAGGTSVPLNARAAGGAVDGDWRGGRNRSGQRLPQPRRAGADLSGVAAGQRARVHAAVRGVARLQRA